MSPVDSIEIVVANTSGRVALLRVQGRLDADTAPVLLDRCRTIQASGQNLVLSLAGVTFLGSSGVGALLALVEQFQEQAGQVHFVALSEAARAVVDLLDLEPYMPIHATEEEGLRALQR